MGVAFYLGILLYPLMENQMEKNMENEMEAGLIWGLHYIIALEFLFGDTMVPNIE